ncbi:MULTISPECIES: hypothetical protein [Bacillus]|uniref:hypothetical protein n=1 Tax=Bacillus TaxID=1386 RepID=UPI0001DA6059|nr:MULTISPECIES: hypothetical protein [Bacillus]EFI64368.1 hypothetical protein BCSJ1_20428 [Bacillus cereus SJ1]MBR9657797.1 hypothetical protein [Bacillus cereus]MCU4901527.1 hypothetical protein [Bacillus cereus]MCU5314188.1 hypothetical protein [Bacillus cereus]MCU5438426.1 hypothetical protein [Bacillus cereus]
MGKLKLSVLSTALVVSMLGVNTSASAAISGSTDSQILQEELSNIEYQSDAVEIINTDELPKDTPTINFDTIEDFEKFVKEYESFQTYNENIVSESSNTLDNQFPIAYANGSKTIHWYTAEDWSSFYKLYLPSKMWIDFTYTYSGSGSNKTFTKITSIKSNSGSIPSSWNQTTAVSNISGNKKSVTIKVTGYFLLGVNIGGQSVGAKFHGSFTKKANV